MDSSRGKSLTWISRFTSLDLKCSFVKGGLGKEKKNDPEFSKVPPTSDFLGTTEIWNSPQGCQGIPLAEM